MAAPETPKACSEKAPEGGPRGGRWLSFALAALAGLLAVPGRAGADLLPSYQFVGQGNWSLDAVGSNSTPVGTLRADVPAGSFVERAFLYSSTLSLGLPVSPTVVFDGVTYAPDQFTPLGITTGPGLSLQAFRADVTAQVQARVGSGGGLTTFTVNSESPNANIDGEVLAVIFSNPGEALRHIAIFDGFAAPTGSALTVNLAGPSDGAEALLSLGIGFSAQAPSNIQASVVDVNGRRLTSAAGGQDDGGLANGALITVGGVGDNPANPTDPFFAQPTDPRFDDELYDLARGNGVNPSPFLPAGATSLTLFLDPEDGDDADNIFFVGVNVTLVPEPSTLTLAVLSTVGGFVYGWRRRKRAD